MDILVVMCVGILVGGKLFPKKFKKINEHFQVVCTMLLIFSMGVMLGQRENFISELSSLGLHSFLFFLFPTVFSIILVYFLTKYFMEKKSTKEEDDK